MKAVLFDCDGVLMNSEEIIEIVLRDTFAQFGASFTLQEIRETFTGTAYEEYMRRRESAFFERTGRPLPAGFQAALDHNFRHSGVQNLKAFDGVRELLQTLKAAGIPFAVASNSGHENLVKKLKATGLHDFFDPHIYSRDHVAAAKPAPDIYLYAAGQIGIAEAQRCIVVEDSAHGVRAGVAASMHVIGIARQDQELPADPQRLIDAGAKETVPCIKTLHTRILTLTGRKPPGPDFRP